MPKTRRRVTVTDVRSFLQATRDSGYRSFDAAISELVDNSLQAQATQVEVFLPNHSRDAGESVAVLDDGRGMSPDELAKSLQFGGSTRFDDRDGMGRFGMGLPNASLSQARRVDVYTWREPGQVWQMHLDLDELLAAREPSLLPPQRGSLPERFRQSTSLSGTLVCWNRLDRVGTATWKSLARTLEHRLGQRFRYFLWMGRSITTNGNRVLAVDPLFLSSDTRTPWLQAKPYGPVLRYPVRFSEGSSPATATIEIQFSELPVQELAPLPNIEKRRYGISNGAGISVVRADREIDYGWFILDKRRENYDDWWRCEIRFPPDLDEVFGVSHTKQGIRPSEELRALLANELGNVARSLNRRARAAHQAYAEERARNATADAATARDVHLRPIAAQPTVSPDPARLHCVDAAPRRGLHQSGYRLVIEEADGPGFYRTELRDGVVTVVLNRLHAFYERFFSELEVAELSPAGTRHHMELILYALGRTELLDWNEQEKTAIERYHAEWSRAISVFYRSA